MTTTWRALTREEIDRGVSLLHVNGKIWTVECVADNHRYYAPLHYQSDGDGIAWVGICGYCQRSYRLRLEVGDGPSR